MTDLLQHWRLMYENKYLGAWDLCDRGGRYREVSAQISDVRWEEIVGEGGRKSRSLVLYLQGSKGKIDRPMILSKTNGKTLQQMFGENPRTWVGKAFTLYARDKRVSGGMAKVLTIRNAKGGQDLKDELASRAAPEAPRPTFADEDAHDEPRERDPGEEG